MTLRTNRESWFMPCDSGSCSCCWSMNSKSLIWATLFQSLETLASMTLKRSLSDGSAFNVFLWVWSVSKVITIKLQVFRKKYEKMVCAFSRR